MAPCCDDASSNSWFSTKLNFPFQWKVSPHRTSTPTEKTTWFFGDVMVYCFCFFLALCFFTQLLGFFVLPCFPPCFLSALVPGKVYSSLHSQVQSCWRPCESFEIHCRAGRWNWKDGSWERLHLYCLESIKKGLQSLKLTFRHLKMDAWNTTYFPI